MIRLEIVLILMQDRTRIATKVPQAQKSILTHPMVLLGGEAEVHVHFVPFGDSANLDAT
jgi:hypothetical protein